MPLNVLGKKIDVLVNIQLPQLVYRHIGKYQHPFPVLQQRQVIHTLRKLLLQERFHFLYIFKTGRLHMLGSYPTKGFAADDINLVKFILVITRKDHRVAGLFTLQRATGTFIDNQQQEIIGERNLLPYFPATPLITVWFDLQ